MWNQPEGTSVPVKAPFFTKNRAPGSGFGAELQRETSYPVWTNPGVDRPWIALLDFYIFHLSSQSANVSQASCLHR